MWHGWCLILMTPEKLVAICVHDGPVADSIVASVTTTINFPGSFDYVQFCNRYWYYTKGHSYH